MGTGISSRGLNRDTRVNFANRLHDDGSRGDTQATQHKYCELMTVWDGNAEPIQQFFIGCRRWLEEQDARRVASREEPCSRGSSGMARPTT